MGDARVSRRVISTWTCAVKARDKQFHMMMMMVMVVAVDKQVTGGFLFNAVASLVSVFKKITHLRLPS